ncbi:MAG: hypothetical protein WD114_06015 [Phycisphaerales bacterium]
MPSFTQIEEQLILDYAVKRISKEDFVHRFPRSLDTPHELVRCLLAPCVHGGEPKDVELVMLLGFVLEVFDESFAPLLAELLLADHHNRHEDIAKELQTLRVPSTLDALVKRCETVPPWPATVDGGAAVFRKCVWAIRRIGTEEAWHALKLLTQSEFESVSQYAQKHLDSWKPY